jgi:hypothetical protein
VKSVKIKRKGRSAPNRPRTGTLSGGSAPFTTSTLRVGTPHIKAVYGGDQLLSSSTSSVVIQVVER